MTALPRILHLVDDTTAGGVMRVLDFIRSDADMAETAQHEIKEVKRGKVMPKLPNADVIVSHLTVSWRGLPALIALKASHPRTPILHVEHSYTESFIVHNVNKPQRFRNLLKTAYALFDRVICVSYGQAEWMRKARLVRQENLSVIQSCVNLEAFQALPARKGPSRVFGAIGRLDPQKGFDTLIRGFRDCANPDIELHIIGTGVQEQELREMAEGDERIIFQGFQTDTAKSLTDLDVVVMPSRWEAYGLVAIETLAAGRKLLCSNVDGLQDHAAIGGVPLPMEDFREISHQISTEAMRATQHTDVPIRLAGKHLEENFRDSWKNVLGQFCLVTSS